MIVVNRMVTKTIYNIVLYVSADNELAMLITSAKHSPPFRPDQVISVVNIENEYPFGTLRKIRVDAYTPKYLAIKLIIIAAIPIKNI